MDYMKRRIFFSIIFFLAIPICASSFPRLPESIEVRSWRILYSQDDSIDRARVAGIWNKIEIPSKFRLPYPPLKDLQYAWLKGEFDITDDPARYYGITFGRIHYTYKIYVNDYLLDMKTAAEIVNFHNPEGFMLPRSILKKGKNEIYIYLGIYGSEYGGLPDGVFVQPKMEYRRLKNFLDLLYNQLPMGILLLLIGSMLLMVAVSIFYGADRLFIYEIMVQLLNALYIIIIFSPFKPVSWVMASSLLLLAIPLFGILFIEIIQALYRISFYEYNWIMYLAILLISAIVIFISQSTMNFYLNPLYGIILIVLFFPYAVYLTYRINTIRADRFKFAAIMVLVGLLIISGLLELLLYSTGSKYSLLVVTYFSPFIILGFAVLGSREYQRRIFRLKLLYDHIDEQKTGSARKKTVTDSTEEKIKKIIGFIEENYTSDISREGLASAVGMNPNYFSGQFREYTGKKINDYINEMRIDDAVVKLRERNARIIDVALSIGFDSLSTFNRAFKNVTGKTPTEYRRELFKGDPSL